MLETYSDFVSKKKFFASNEIIDSVKDWDDFVQSLPKGKNYVYRGVNNSSYKMYSSFQRKWDSKQVDSYNKINRNFNDHWEFAQYLIDVVKNHPDLPCFLSGDGIDINSMALLQHFGYPSMLIDFSYDLKIALFFMTENMEAEYCSLYYINDEENPYKNCSLEDVNATGLKKLAELCSLDDLHIVNYEKVLKEFENLPLSNYKNIDYILVKGGVNNPTVSKSNDLGVQFTYNFTNPRMGQQRGLFFLNTTPDKPLESLILDHNYNFIHCVNVKKDVVLHIKQNYISEVTRENLYYPNKGAQSIEKIFEDLKKQNKI
ncbi:MAG: FRG domain-containing protein [Paludibacteraceae bacterium]|nr:FRG domain-containing protein [Paludibacteraceae bacterium]